MDFKTAAVFCGSKSGNNPLFTEHAEILGNLLAEHGITLVYGGGRVGLMGTVANAVMNHSGKVIGVIPEDETILISTNRGWPAAMDEKSRAGQAFRNIARRLQGEEVPFMSLEDNRNVFQRLRERLGGNNRSGG